MPSLGYGLIVMTLTAGHPGRKRTSGIVLGTNLNALLIQQVNPVHIGASIGVIAVPEQPALFFGQNRPHSCRSQQYKNVLLVAVHR